MGTIIGDIPVTERFFEGGANSHRGFGERSLSPFVSGVVNGILVDVPYGGGAMAELSEEARFPLGHLIGMPLGGVAFMDGGDATQRFSDLRWLDLHWAPGLGLRVHTAVGAVRVDVAYRINRFEPGEPQAGSHVAFHFSIGEAF